MSMTPLQAIAAVKILENNSIATNAIETYIQPYSSHSLIQTLRASMMSPPPAPTNPGNGGGGFNGGIFNGGGSGSGGTTPAPVPETPAQVATALSAAWPAVMGFIDAAQTSGLLAATPDAYSLPEALIAHCKKVIGNGDICKFSQAVDRASSFISITNEMFDVIEKGKNLKLSDLGPGVTTHSQSTNAGLVGIANTITQSINDAGNPIPAIPNSPQTTQVAAALVIAAIGEVAGDPSSANFGTAVGIYEKAKAKGLDAEVASIHASLIENVGVPTIIPIPGISSEYQTVIIKSNASPAEVNSLLDQLDAKAYTDSNSNLISSQKEQAQRMADWVDNVRTVGISALMSEVQIAADIALSEQLSPTYDITQNITAMGLAINSLDRSDASMLFSKLGATVDVDMLSKYTDILDFKAMTVALPTTITGSSTKALAAKDATAVANFGVLFDKIPKVVGEDKGGILRNTHARPRQIAVSPFKPLTKSQVASLEKAANYSGNDIGIRQQLGLPETPSSRMASDNLSIGAGVLAEVDANIEAQASVADFISDATVEPASNGTSAPNGAGAGSTAVSQNAEGAIADATENSQTLAEKTINALATKTTAQTLGNTLKQIKGFGSTADLADVSNALLLVEPPTGPTNLLDEPKEVIPEEVEKSFKNSVGTGSAANSGYKLNDFFGSVCGLNEQKEMWRAVVDALDEIQNRHGSLLSNFQSANTTPAKAAVLTSARAEYGSKLDNALNAALSKFKQEWAALTSRAKVDYSNLLAGDAVSAVLVAKKLAQYANNLESGHAAIFQSLANVSTMGGQAVVAVMTEARNTKLLLESGLTPTSQTVVTAGPITVTEADRKKTSEISNASAGLVSTSVEGIARQREINTLPAPSIKAEEIKQVPVPSVPSTTPDK
ncbi:hypothetical protein UFOVP116_96 [uncultured Caudovirales phage]|uniref:Uncharacterized protein n=1 Tax=uncultured Caudovirales phage TaxID=2100421 RepID=A0A6J5LA18_9CAUD|nr:hypothetical protein UFOVP116_96 [uncultured Caudovirales phage]